MAEAPLMQLRRRTFWFRWGSMSRKLSRVSALAWLSRLCRILAGHYCPWPPWRSLLAPAIEPRLRTVGDICKRHGYIAADIDRLHGRELGMAVAEGMIELRRRVGFPATLAEIPRFTNKHIEREIAAAKDPQLELRLLRNMPVPLSVSQVDEYIRPIPLAAKTGDLNTMVNMP